MGCCHCEPLPTTTPTTTTAAPTTTKTPCPVQCVVPITCEDEADFRLGSRAIPFEIRPECMFIEDCGCPGNATRDMIWETGMCLQLNEQCEEPCLKDGDRYAPGETFERGCKMCTCEYEMFFFEKCMPFCNLTQEQCEEQGQILENNPDECCSCVAPPTTTPEPQTTTPAP